MVKPPLPLFALPLTFLLSLAAPVHAVCFTAGADGAQGSSACWNTVNPVPGTLNLEGILRSDAEYLALGEGGAILTSPDGVDWTPRDSGTTQRLYNAIWDGARYVAVGEGGLVLTSPDGAAWTSQVTDTRLALFDVAWNGDASAPLYVAVGQNGTLLTSEDAVEWTARDISISEGGEIGGAARPTLRAITWGGTGAASGFVAVGTSGTIISGNGIAWRVNNYDPGGPFIRDVAANPNGLFAAVGAQGTVFTSQGITDEEWLRVPITAHPGADLRGITWDNGNPRFIAVGSEGTGIGLTGLILASSPTGEFGGTTSAPDIPLKAVATDGASSAVAVADRAIVRAAFDQLPGFGWVELQARTELTRDLHGLVHAEGATSPYVAVGAGGTILHGPDGFVWTEADTGVDPPLGVNAVAWNGEADPPVLVAVGDIGTLLRSTDGINWDPAAAQGIVDASLAAVAHGGDQFIAVGQQGAVLASADGDSWSPVTPEPTGEDMRGIAVGTTTSGLVWVAVGARGEIITSADGVTWQSRRDAGATTGPLLMAVAWSGTRFVAVGSEGVGNGAGVVLTSPDGSEWSPAEVPEGGLPRLQAVAWNGVQFMAAADDGHFARSTDGQVWTLLGSAAEDAVSGPLAALAWDGRRFLAAGAGGAILNSGGVDVLVALDGSSDPEDSPVFAPADAVKTFRFNVTNIGNLDAEEVVFTYIIPEGLRFSEGGIEGPPGRQCQIFGAGTEAQCRLLRQVAGTGAGAPIAVSVITGGEGEIDSTVTVDALDDAVPANNTLTFTTAIGRSQTPTLPSPDVDFDRGGALDPWALLALTFGLGLAASRRFRRAQAHL